MRKLSVIGLSLVMLGPAVVLDEHWDGRLSIIPAAEAQQMGRGPVELNRGVYELNRAALIETVKNQHEQADNQSSGGSSGSTSVGPTTVYNFNSTAVDNLNQITQTLSGGSTGGLSLGVKQSGQNSTQTANTSGSVSEALSQILQSGAKQ